MKKTKMLGIIFAAALALVLAACVYEGEIQIGGGSDALPNAVGATFTPGTYTVTVGQDEVAAQNWRRGGMTVEVDFSTNRIEDIRVISHGESMYSSMYFFRAYPMVPDYILVHQSTNNLRVDRSQPAHHQAVHTFTGGTATQEMIVTAVDRAIVQAGADPLALQHQTQRAPLPGDRFIPSSILVYVPSETYVFANGTFHNVNNMPSNLPAWPSDAPRNDNGVGQAIPNDDPRRPADPEGRIVGGTWTTPNGWRSNGFSNWRYGLNANNEGTFTGSNAEGPTVASRVMFHSPLMNRNPNALAGPTWAETRIGNGVVTLGGGVVGVLTARYGTEQNVHYVPGQNTPTGMWLLVNFGRNVFQVAEHHAGDGIGIGGGAPVSGGESLSSPRRPGNALDQVGMMEPFAPENAVYGQLNIAQQSVAGSSSSQGLGGYWWMQVAHRTINDNQSTHLVLPHTYAGSTQSAMAVRLGVEMAMRQAGADPATITPLPNPFYVEPQPGSPEALWFVPGRYYIEVPGFGIINDGSDMMAVTICRETIRYIGSADMNALRVGDGTNAQSREMWGEAGRPEWVNDWNRFRNEILYAFSRTHANGGRQLSALQVPPMEGNVELSNAIITALSDLLWAQSYNFGGVNQNGRLGQEVVPSPFRGSFN